MGTGIPGPSEDAASAEVSHGSSQPHQLRKGLCAPRGLGPASHLVPAGMGPQCPLPEIPRGHRSACPAAGTNIARLSSGEQSQLVPLQPWDPISDVFHVPPLPEPACPPTSPSLSLTAPGCAPRCPACPCLPCQLLPVCRMLLRQPQPRQSLSPASWQVLGLLWQFLLWTTCFLRGMQGGEERGKRAASRGASWKGLGGSMGRLCPHMKLRHASALNLSQWGWRQGKRCWGWLLPAIAGVLSWHQPPCSTVRMAQRCFPLRAQRALLMPPHQREVSPPPPPSPSSAARQVCVQGPVSAGHPQGMEQHHGGRPQAPTLALFLSSC